MPDVGTLNITIQSDAEQAAEGLGKLAKKLEGVKSAASGFTLANITTQITEIVSSVKGSDKTVAALGTLFNAISNFAKIKTPKIDVTPIKTLKKAFEGGINTGNVGSQLNQLREALAGEWNTDNAGKASSVLSTIATGANELNGSGISTVAKDVSAVAKALDEYAQAAEKIKSVVGENAWSGQNMMGSATAAELKEVGANVPEGMAESMVAGKDIVAKAGNEIGHAGIDGIKEAVDAHSPSREAMKIGGYIVDGLIEGIQQKKSEIQAVMADLSKSMLGTLKEGTASAPGDWRGAMMGLDSGRNGKGKQTNTGVISSIKQLTDALQGAGGLNDYAQGLTAISSAIDSGAKSYLTLGRLATSMEKVKAASSGFKLPDFSRLESLARSLQENFHAENGLLRIAEGMEAIKAASDGFKMPSMKGIEKVIAAMNGATAATQSAQPTAQTQAAGGSSFAAELQQVNSTVQDFTTSIITLNGELANTFDIFNGAGSSGFYQFKEMLDTMMQFKSAHALGSGESGLVSPMESWKEGAIEVEGTVSDAYDGIKINALEAGDAFTEAASSMNAIIPYGKNLEDSWDHLNQLVEDYNQRVRESRVEGYGTIGSIRDLYASTDLRGKDAPGPALRGKLGYGEHIEARNQVAEITGMPIEEINRQLVQLGEDARQAKAEVMEMMNALNKPLDWGNLSQGVDRMQGIGSEAKSAEDSMRVFLEAMGDGSAQSQKLQVDNPELAQFRQRMDEVGVAAQDFTGKLVDVDGELKAKKTDADEATKGFLGLKETFNDLKKAFSTTVFGKLAKQFANIAKRMAIRAVIRQVTSAFKEGTENVYRYSQAIGSSFASNMDSAATSLLQLKNSIGAAVAPLIQAVIPYLNQLISKIIEGINYINQFFALLNGQTTWTKALPYATQAFEDQKKSAKGAHQAMKDLLADWDELNIIQSENSSGGSGGTGKKQEDYTSMFEEESIFDDDIIKIAEYAKEAISFITDHFAEIFAAVKAIKWGIRLTRFSSAFTGALSSLLSIVGAGIVIGMTIDVTKKSDKNYLKTGEDGWLVLDALTNLVGSTLAGSIIGRVLGGGVGLITAGLTLAVSGGVSYGIAIANEDNANSDTLAKIGLIKSAIGTALTAAGFAIIAGPAGLVAGAAVAAAMFTISAAVSTVIEQLETAEQIADKTFSETGEGGISVDEIFNQLQIKFDEKSKNFQLSIDAFSNVPTLKTDLAEAFSTIQSLTATVKSKDGLTQDEADKFKAAWDTVFDAFEGITADSFNTVFTGLNASLSSEIEEIRTRSRELRIELLKIQQGVTGAQAEFKVNMEDLRDKVASGKATDEELEEYLDYVETVAKATHKQTSELDKINKESVKIDFGDEEHALENMLNFVEKASEASKADITSIDEGLQANIDALQELRDEVKMYHDLGLIGDEEFSLYTSTFNETEETIKSEAERKKKEISDLLLTTYKSILDQAFTGLNHYMDENGNVDAFDAGVYMFRVIAPIVKAIKDAGGEVDEAFLNMFGIGANAGEMISALLDSSDENDIIGWLTRYYAGEVEGASEALENTETPVVEPEIDVEPDIQIDNWSVSEKIYEAIFDAADAGTLNAGMLKELAEKYKLDLQSVLNYMQPEYQDEDTLEKIQKIIDEINKTDGLKLHMPQVDSENVGKKTNDAATAYENMASRIKAAFSSIDGLGFKLNLNGADGSITVNYPIAQMASGGFVKSGDLVMADENGNFEMKGRMGNQPVVANNQQIVSGISQGVSQANGDVVSELRTLTTMMQKMLNKEFVARAVPSSAWGNHNVRSQEAYNKVTG